MFSSDVLDAVAIGAGAALLGGIVAGIFSYLINRTNIQAKRSEIAFEKRLEAFGAFVTAFSDTKLVLERFRDLSIS